MKQSRSATEASHNNYNSRSLSQVRSLGLKPPQMKYQALRLQVINKLEAIIGIFKKNEKQLSNFFTRYMPLPQSQINLRRYSDERFEEIRLIKTVNKIYFGHFRDKQRYGEGVLIDETNKIFEGTFSENMKAGHGVEIYPNKNIYIGEFSGNKKHGHGQFFWFNLSYPIIPKSRYVECYEGTWWGGLPDGRGTHQKASGDLYKGDFKNGLKHGEGEEDFQNGDVYKGEYVNGLPQGNGIYIWADGSRYQGQFKQGLRNGRGIWKSSKDHEEYRGEYVLDKKCGYGEFLWEKKSYLYKGYFQNDLRHGYGQLFFRSELEYKGNWINGKTELDLTASVCSRNSHRSQRSNRSVSVKNREFIRTPKGSNLPSLSKGRRPPTSLKQFYPLQVLKERKALSRNRSPKNNIGSLNKFSKPKKKVLSVCSSKEKIPKKRPISYNKKPFKSEISQDYLMPTREFIDHICKKKNCGCHDEFNPGKKAMVNSRRRPITHLSTEPMCF